MLRRERERSADCKQIHIALAGVKSPGGSDRVASPVLDVPEVETPLAIPVHLGTLVYMI